MKDVAADEAEGAFEIERREDLPAEHRTLEVRRMAVDRLDHQVGDRLRDGRPTTLRPAAPARRAGRTGSRRAARAARACRRASRRSPSRRSAASTSHACAHRNRPAPCSARLGAMMMPAVWCSARLASRQAGEVRQFGERHVHAERAGAAAPRFRSRSANDGGSAARSISCRYRSFGLRLEIDRAGADRLARLGHDADRAALLDDHLAHRRADADVGAVRGRGLRHRLRDRPHAADRVAPRALLAVHLAEAVMQQHVGRARRVGARIVADDAVESVGRLDRRAFEPAVEIVAGRTW